MVVSFKSQEESSIDRQNLKKRSAALFSLEAIAVLNDFGVNHLESGFVTEAIHFLTKSLY
jgi:hypothetical protein